MAGGISPLILPIYSTPYAQFSILAIYSQSGRNETHVDDPPNPTAFSTFIQEGHQLLTEREYSLDVERHELCERLVGVGLEGFAPCGSRVVDQDVENCRPWRGGGKRCQRRDLGQEEEASGLPFSRRPISSASLTQSSYLKPAASIVSSPLTRTPSYYTKEHARLTCSGQRRWGYTPPSRACSACRPSPSKRSGFGTRCRLWRRSGRSPWRSERITQRDHQLEVGYNNERTGLARRLAISPTPRPPPVTRTTCTKRP